MTQRTTFTIEASDSVRHGIPSISYDDANATVLVNSVGQQQNWSGVRIDHKPEPGFSQTSLVRIVKQSNGLPVVSNTDYIELYYPNHPLHGNANLNSNQASLDWDTHYYMEIFNSGSSRKREIVAIRKIIL